MKRKMKWLTLLAGVVLAGCSNGDTTKETDGPLPFEQVAGIIALEEYLPADIHATYSEEGQTRLRMAFPDENHRDIALKQIGRQVPDLTLSTLGGDVSLRDLAGERLVVNLSSTSASVTAEMAPELEQHAKDKDMRLIHLYPNDSEEDVKSFHEEHGLSFDKDNIVAGNGSDEAREAAAALGSEYVPTLLYVDETGTVSYLSIGFRDAILLDDNYDAAFLNPKLYTYLSGYELEVLEEE